MKKYIILPLLFTLASLASYPQVADGKIKIDNLKITETGDKVAVTFSVETNREIPANNTLVMAPVLTDGTYKVSMPPVIVQGRRARKLTDRYEWVSGMTFDYEKATLTAPGERITYSATVTSQLWMEGADLVFETVEGGCCTYGSLPALTMVHNIHLRDPMALVVEIPAVKREEAYIFVPETLADSLSITFPFVVKADNEKERDPLNIYDDERDNALIVYYGVGSSTINPSYRDNRQILLNLTEVVNMIKNDPNSRVKNIVIAGFASPEGPYTLNDRLAFERAVSVKHHILVSTGIPDQDVLIYNGSVDWRGLRYMVSKSNLPERDQIMEIIDTIPVEPSGQHRGRLGELMKLNGGENYRHLLKEYFPCLRNGAFIKVYYENQ